MSEKPNVTNDGYYIPTQKDREIYSKMSVILAVPHGDYTNYAKFTKCVANMVAYSWHYGLKIYQMGTTERTVVDWARNCIAGFCKDMICPFTDGKYTHIMWLDDDHVFNPDMACYLARHDVDMITGLYFARLEPHHPSVYVKDTSADKYKHFPIVQPPPQLFECDACGFGAMFMNRKVLDRVPQPWFTIDARAGEDIAFCVHAKENGVKIWCDGSYRLGHITAPVIVSESTYLQYQKEHPEKFGDKVKIALGGKAAT
jgi:hypothetical protein